MSVLREEVAIEAVRSKAFVKVRLLHCLSDVFETKQACRVYVFVHHLFIRRLLDNQLALHVLRSSVDLFKVLCNDLLHLLAILEDLRVLPFNLPSDP